MGVFPQMGIIDQNVWDTINSRKGNNTEVSKLTSWIRISSAVDAGLIIETIPHNQDFASTYGISGKSGRVGVSFDNKDVFADGSDRIHRPSPVIEGLEVQNGHQGLSRKASFSIKCFTLAQAEKITQYFYEPGYIVLIEYGWNTPDSMNERISLNKDGACEIAKFNNYEYIRKKRKASKGTYDGFMGRIAGGGYKNGSDDTYIIDVELVTLGEIPAYLQVHKSGRTNSKEESSSKFITADIDKHAERESTRGLALYQQMYNRLPAEKRTINLKTLIGKNFTDKYSKRWTDARNFVNVDDKIRETLIQSLEGSKADVDDDVTVKIPDGVSLMSDESFIRLELAFQILNTYAVNLEIRKTGRCEDAVSSYSYIINTSDTVIGAHKYMFSTDGQKLMIPNTNHPEFGLKQALTATDELQPYDYIDPRHIRDHLANVCPWKGGKEDEEDYAFPATYDYKSPHMEGVKPRTAKAGNWGYLRNLYINLDFFIDVMTRGSFVAKDIYYELLNGLSLAAGSYWHFEITETPYNPEPGKRFSEAVGNPYILSIQDYNFLGIERTEKDEVRELYSKGVGFMHRSFGLSCTRRIRKVSSRVFRMN